VKNHIEKRAISLNVEVLLLPNHQREFLQVALKLVNEGRMHAKNESYHLHRDMEKDYYYEMHSKWQDKKSMEDYIRSQTFGALLGALNILSLKFDIKIHSMSLKEGKDFINQVRKK
jgi:quinol monooxygenase YgiN